MKAFFCAVLLAFLGTALAETPQEKLQKHSDACKTESGATDEAIRKAQTQENIDDPKVKEHGLCILKRTGVMNNDGELQIETIRTKFTESSHDSELVEKLIKKCAVQKSTPQDTAGNFFGCVHEFKNKARAQKAEKFQKLSDACKTESGASDEAITKARTQETIDDPKLKEHGLCILKKTGLINNDGELQIETMRTKFTEVTQDSEFVEKLVKKCAVQKSTPQDTAGNFFGCYHELENKAKAESRQEKLQKLSNACKVESGASDEAITKARTQEQIDDPKLKEHALCVLKKTGVINNDGELQIETIRTKFTEVTHDAEFVEQLIKKCAIQKSTPQDTAGNFFGCYHGLQNKAKATV